MVTIELEPQCLECGHIDIQENVSGFSDAGGVARIVHGSITCAHAATCKRMGASPTVSQALDELHSMIESGAV